MPRSDFDHIPSLLEIMYENGEIEEYWDEPVIDCGHYYIIDHYKYANSFPILWAKSHVSGTGPAQCNNCDFYGNVDGIFIGYCANCADYFYNFD